MRFLVIILLRFREGSNWDSVLMLVERRVTTLIVDLFDDNFFRRRRVEIRIFPEKG